MNTRFATVEDLGQITLMYLEFKGEEFESFSMKYDPQVTSKSISYLLEQGRVIVLETEGKIFGMLAGCLSPSMTSKDIYFVGCLFYIQTGIRSMTKRFIAEAKALLKKHTLASHMVIANPAFENFEKYEHFYARLEFKKLETHWIAKI